VERLRKDKRLWFLFFDGTRETWYMYVCGNTDFFDNSDVIPIEIAELQSKFNYFSEVSSIWSMRRSNFSEVSLFPPSCIFVVWNRRTSEFVQEMFLSKQEEYQLFKDLNNLQPSCFRRWFYLNSWKLQP
jgi:hypothetical protein